MEFDLDTRSASLGVGEFAEFSLGPRESEGGPQGLWRAQLGTHWHQQLRKQAEAAGREVRFEVSLRGQILHKGWLLTLNGRLDQYFPGADTAEVREIKSVLRTLPADEVELRAEYPGYFVQAAVYQRLLSTDSQALGEGVGMAAPTRCLAMLVFVEADTGLTQSLRLGAADEGLLEAQLDRVVGFLEQRRLSRERLAHMRLRKPFEVLREGQEEAITGLQSALVRERPVVLFEAPTGFGKTGVLLEAALGELRRGRFERLAYLTSKATGQLQVADTLRRMTWPAEGAEPDGLHAVSSWVVRPKTEHCINEVFLCSRESCPHLKDLERKWAGAGLARHYLDPEAPRDIATLRESGREAGICPYEITRAALPFCDLWIGDFNYLFSPSSNGLFLGQPGFEAARTLLVVDEAHNLPTRAADALSHRLEHAAAQDVLDGLHRIHAPNNLVRAWDHWTHFLKHLLACNSLSLAAEDDARDLLSQAAGLVTGTALDHMALGAELSRQLWAVAETMTLLSEHPRLARHWWAPKRGSLSITCLDAAPFTGPLLASFGGAILASATFGPHGDYAAAIGLESAREVSRPLSVAKQASQEDKDPGHAPGGRFGSLNKRDSRKLLAKVTTASELMRVEEEHEQGQHQAVRALAPWRDRAFRVGIDLRADTRFEQREQHHGLTAATIQRLCEGGAVAGARLAVFFPSYAYAEAILQRLNTDRLLVRAALQARNLDLAGQTAWIEQALVSSDALFLVLGSSFAESIDLLGGRLPNAMVVGPALPEVNAVQQAKLANLAPRGREQAFRSVYQIPGMQKVNQALGRLVRAPGQRARILLHCRRFAEPAYTALLGREYAGGTSLHNDQDFEAWLQQTDTQT